MMMISTPTIGANENLQIPSQSNAHHGSAFINDNENGLHRDFERWLEKLAPENPHD